MIAVNTSQDRLGLGQRRLAATGRLLEEEAGGLSGRPLRQRALEVLRRLRATAGPALPLVGVGGIDGPQAAWERITAGASLVQLIESSSITAHYSPHWKIVCLNIFTCKTFDAQKTLEFVKKYFKASHARSFFLSRGPLSSEKK